MTDPTGRVVAPLGGPADQGDTAVLHELASHVAPRDLAPERRLPASALRDAAELGQVTKPGSM